jgi:hypothetical protein
LMGEYISAATMEISIEAHQKTKNRATIWSKSDTTLGNLSERI